MRLNIVTQTRKKKDTIQYNTIRVYCENSLSYNNGVLLPADGTEIGVCESTPANLQVFHKHKKKLGVKKLDMEYSIIKIITIKS